MDIDPKSDKGENNITLYESISNTWNVILDFLDINTFFQLEAVSKFFRNRLLFYYETKEALLKNNTKENKENIEHIINFKKEFLSKYFNLLVNIDISDTKFCNEENITNFPITKKAFTKIETNLFKKNRIMIKQILLKENNIFILYKDNTFSINQFDYKDNNKIFKEIYSYDFLSSLIDHFKYYENDKEKIIFFVKKNSTEFFYLNLNEEEKSIKIFELQKQYEIFNKENFYLKEIFILNDFFLFLMENDEFILVPNDMLSIFTQQKNKNKNSDKSDDEDKDENKINQMTIPYPQKLEKNYGDIHYINSNNLNVVFINNEYQIYSIPITDCKNYKNNVPKFKAFSEQKFPNFYCMGFSSNSFLLLEKTRLKPLEEWNNEEIYKWFEEMDLDDYLNIIKYQKITGKDIVNGGKDYLLDVMGLEEDHINKINYEMSTLKFETSKDMKLWAWGNNKNGQLGLNNQTFVKLPTLITLPNMMQDDTIEKIYCYKTYSVLLTKFGNIFITGKYTIKDQMHTSKKNKDNNNNNNKKNKGKNKHKEENKKKADKKEKEKNNEKDNLIGDNMLDNNWINLSKSLCYCAYNIYNSNKNNKNNNENDAYFKIKEIFGENDNISFIGFYSNKTPFFAIQRKPKFKHLKKGGKFITSNKVIEHIQEFLKDKIDTFKVVYGDSLLKMLETNLPDYLESEIPFHKIIQIKDNNEVIWDRKKRYFKENFINENINKI